MKRLIWLFMLIIAFPLSGQTNPCEDSTFVRLKTIPINDMSQREYDYFMMMSKECASFLQSHVATTAQDTLAITIRSVEQQYLDFYKLRVKTALGITVFLVLLIVLLGFILAPPGEI